MLHHIFTPALKGKPEDETEGKKPEETEEAMNLNQLQRKQIFMLPD